MRKSILACLIAALTLLTACGELTAAATPDAPSNLSAAFQNDAITLTWQDNSDNETGFTVYRRLADGTVSQSLSQFTQLTTASANDTRYVDNTLTAGQTYLYAVTATGLLGTSQAVYLDESEAVSVPASDSDDGDDESGSVDGGGDSGDDEEGSSDEDESGDAGDEDEGDDADEDSSDEPDGDEDSGSDGGDDASDEDEDISEPDYVGTFVFSPAKVVVGDAASGYLNLPDSVDCSISVNGGEPYTVDCVGDIALTRDAPGTTKVEITAFKADGYHIYLTGSFEAVADAPDFTGDFIFEPAEIEVGQTASGYLNLPDSEICYLKVDGGAPEVVDCVGDISLTPEEAGTTEVEIRAFKASGYHIYLTGELETIELPRYTVELTTRANKPIAFKLSDLVSDANGLYEVAGAITNGRLSYFGLGFFYGCCFDGEATYIPDVNFTGTEQIVFEIVEPPVNYSRAQTIAYVDMTIVMTEDTTDANAPCSSRIITIRDIRLRNAIHGALNTDFNGDVTCAQIGDITQLDAGGGDFKGGTVGEVKNLNGLEYAVNLEEINLFRTTANDFSPLLGLNKLEKLTFGFGSMPSIKQLSTLESLRDLHLSYAGVSDLSGIEPLKNLERLYLQSTGVVDLAPLQGLTRLEYLDISYNSSALDDISPLFSLPWSGNNDTVDLRALQNISQEQIETLQEKVENVLTD